ncbi:ATP-grasp domain-containing protein [Georgenia halophila]|uniref:ATP-grasp domain-containing protein n=1 Tax=Georgenia halophila TaxID=620889 RepID=A0ABP8KZQ1_9MICO
MLASRTTTSGATKILVTGVGGPAGRSLGAQLAALGNNELVGVDVTAVDDPHFPTTEIVPRADDLDYARAMREVIERHAPDLVIPTVQDELPQLAVLAELLGVRQPADGRHRSAVVVSSPHAAAVTADKYLTMWALDAAGVPVPRFVAATEIASTEAALAWGGGPVVVKPRLSRGGRGVRLVEQVEDLEWSEIGSGAIVQEFAPGTEYSPQLYVTAAGEVTVVVLEKTELKQGRVGNASEAVRVPDGAAADVAEVATATVRALGLAGPIDMDVRLDSGGRPVVLEVNSRFGASSALAPELVEAVLHEWLP